METWIPLFIYGLIEGITEFLPVSSTGHLLIIQHWLPRQSDLFNIFIQSGAVLAILPLFPNRIQQVFRAWKDPEARDYVGKLVLAFVVTGVGGLILDRMGWQLPESVVPVALALIAGGMLFVVAERILRGRTPVDQISWKLAAAVGIAQLAAAVFPGLSRSGACIILLLLCGVSRPLATEFSFLVGIPTILAAGGLKLVEALGDTSQHMTAAQWGGLAFGTVVSAIVSFVVVRWLLGYVKTHSFEPFGYYRIVLGVGLLLFLL